MTVCRMIKSYLEEMANERKVTAYILALFLICLDVPSLVYLLIPSKTGGEEAFKIVVVVFVGGLVNFSTGLVGWFRLRRVRENWRPLDSTLSKIFVVCILWMVWTFILIYIKQLLLPLP